MSFSATQPTRNSWVLRRYAFGVMFICWMAAITIMSLISFDDDSSLSIEIPHFDKFVHFTFYFIAGILGIFHAKTIKKEFTSNTGLLIKFLLVLIGYGIIIEVLQESITTYRSAEFLDVLANSAGAITATLLMWAIFSGKAGLK